MNVVKWGSGVCDDGELRLQAAVRMRIIKKPNFTNLSFISGFIRALYISPGTQRKKDEPEKVFSFVPLVSFVFKDDFP